MKALCARSSEFLIALSLITCKRSVNKIGRLVFIDSLNALHMVGAALEWFVRCERALGTWSLDVTLAYETRLYSMRGERNHKLCKLNIEHTSNRGVITESFAA